MENMYAAPASNLDETIVKDDTYMPKFFSFSGRIGRLRYLAYQVSMVLLSYLFLFGAAGLFFAASSTSSLSGTFDSVFGGVALVVFVIGMLIGSVTVTKRRLNDLGNSGWYAILMFVPYLNFFFSLYLIFSKGNEGSNEYGPAPGANSRAVIWGALVIPILMLVGILAAVALPAYKDYTDRAKARAQATQVAPN